MGVPPFGTCWGTTSRASIGCSVISTEEEAEADLPKAGPPPDGSAALAVPQLQREFAPVEICEIGAAVNGAGVFESSFGCASVFITSPTDQLSACVFDSLSGCRVIRHQFGGGRI